MVLTRCAPSWRLLAALGAHTTHTFRVKAEAQPLAPWYILSMLVAIFIIDFSTPSSSSTHERGQNCPGPQYIVDTLHALPTGPKNVFNTLRCTSMIGWWREGAAYTQQF